MTAALGLSGALCWAAVDLFAVRLSRSLGSVATTYWILAIGFLVLVPAKVIADRGEPLFADLGSVGYAALAGALDAIGFVALAKGLATGNLSVVAPLAGLSGGVSTLISVGLGERLGGRTIAGLVLGVLGGVAAGTEHRGRSARGVGWGLLAAACFGGLFAFVGKADGITEYEAILVARVVGLLMVGPIFIRRGHRLPSGRDRWLLFAGAIDVIGFVLFAVAAQRGPVSVASVAGAQVATFAAVLGVAFLRERPAWWQAVGVAVTAAGVTLMALSG